MSVVSPSARVLDHRLERKIMSAEEAAALIHQATRSA